MSSLKNTATCFWCACCGILLKEIVFEYNIECTFTNCSIHHTENTNIQMNYLHAEGPQQFCTQYNTKCSAFSHNKCLLHAMGRGIRGMSVVVLPPPYFYNSEALSRCFSMSLRVCAGPSHKAGAVAAELLLCSSAVLIRTHRHCVEPPTCSTADYMCCRR